MVRPIHTRTLWWRDEQREGGEKERETDKETERRELERLKKERCERDAARSVALDRTLLG